MANIRKMSIATKRPIMIINGKIHRHWEIITMPRKTAIFPEPGDLKCVIESAPDGDTIVEIDNKLSVMKPGSRHVTRFRFSGEKVKLEKTKAGRLVICINGEYKSIEPFNSIGS